MKKDKLKPCPFCGKEIKKVRYEWCECGTEKIKYQVYCPCGIKTEWFAQEIMAFKTWNKRSSSSLKG